MCDFCTFCPLYLAKRALVSCSALLLYTVQQVVGKWWAGWCSASLAARDTKIVHLVWGCASLQLCVRDLRGSCFDIWLAWIAHFDTVRTSKACLRLRHLEAGLDLSVLEAVVPFLVNTAARLNAVRFRFNWETSQVQNSIVARATL